MGPRLTDGPPPPTTFPRDRTPKLSDRSTSVPNAVPPGQTADL
jgi:hypothetical protein